jgi:hypothetical protein
MQMRLQACGLGKLEFFTELGSVVLDCSLGDAEQLADLATAETISN